MQFGVADVVVTALVVSLSGVMAERTPKREALRGSMSPNASLAQEGRVDSSPSYRFPREEPIEGAPRLTDVTET